MDQSMQSKAVKENFGFLEYALEAQKMAKEFNHEVVQFGYLGINVFVNATTDIQWLCHDFCVALETRITTTVGPNRRVMPSRFVQNMWPTQMSPMYVEILLWYYHSPMDYPNLDAPIVKSAIQEFVEAGILMKSEGERQYECVRPALEVYVKELLAVPLPKQVWICERLHEKPIK